LPVYQYVCRKCAHPFEELVFTSDAPPACPACQADDAEKVLSVVTVGKSHAAAPVCATTGERCGSCVSPAAPRPCGMN
jgi:putative FmdB family regulatory protein